MNGSSNLLVLGVTGRVGRPVAKTLKRKEATSRWGSRRITGYTVDTLVQSKSLIDAAKCNGVTNIVHLGAFTREHDSYATVFAWHRMIEANLRDSGVGWTNLHPNMFMQSLLSVWSVKGALYSPYTSKAIGFTALEDVADAAALILREGAGKTQWKGLVSADVLAVHEVAETLTAATGREFTEAVGDPESFQNDVARPGAAFEPAYAKGGLKLFRQVVDGRMAYVGSVKDDTKKILGREPVLLRDGQKYTPMSHWTLRVATTVELFHLNCKLSTSSLLRLWPEIINLITRGCVCIRQKR